MNPKRLWVIDSATSRQTAPSSCSVSLVRAAVRIRLMPSSSAAWLRICSSFCTRSVMSLVTPTAPMISSELFRTGEVW